MHKKMEKLRFWWNNAQKNLEEYLWKKWSWNEQKKTMKWYKQTNKQTSKIRKCTAYFLISEVNNYYLFFWCYSGNNPNPVVELFFGNSNVEGVYEGTVC